MKYLIVATTLLTSCAIGYQAKNCKEIFRGRLAGVEFMEFTCKSPPGVKKCPTMIKVNSKDYRCILRSKK